METVVLIVIALVIIGIAFLLGRYLLPKIKTSDLDTLEWLSTWAYKFVVTAQSLMSNKNGQEQNKTVAEQITDICKEKGINISATQLTALIEAAYVAMKKGEDIAKMKQGEQNDK